MGAALRFCPHCTQTVCMSSGYRREDLPLLGYYAASSGKFLPKVRYN